MGEHTRTTADAPASDTEERVLVATQWQLMRWRFRKHTLAVIGLVIVILFYSVALFADFFAYSASSGSEAQRSLIAPSVVHWIDEGRFAPYVYGLTGTRDPNTFKRVYVVDPQKKISLRLFAHGYPYKVLGLTTDVHLIGVTTGNPEDSLFLLGTDQQGRDVWSRLMIGTRTSLSIGLVGVVISLVLGILLGGISGFYGGTVDTFIQRLIEVVRSVPTIPLWMGVAAAVPSNWNVTQVYFSITLIISLIGWTELARVVRGRFLSLREEDFVMAAEFAGCSQLRIIFRHMVPSFMSHIIAATTLAIPTMIISETSLSFLGLGLRPPAISWGVLLQDAQSVQAVALTPWLLAPTIPVILVILSLNFLGDGLRDAADPYAS